MTNTDENLNIVPSGYRILFTFYTLLNEELSPKELNEKLQKNTLIDKTFTKEALLKFINTLKASDVEIKKEQGKYFINKLPWKIDLSDKNYDTLVKLYGFACSLQQKELEKDYHYFINDILKYSSENFDVPQNCYQNPKYSKYSTLIKKIENFTKSEQKIILKCKNKEEHKFDNFKLEYKKGNVYLTGYNLKLNENKTINLENIKTITHSPQKLKGVIFPPTITFKLKGRLAAGYNLKPNEKLLSQNTNELIICNKGEDKNVLMRRLLKYKNLCEIIGPKSLKEDFKRLIQNTLENYQ